MIQEANIRPILFSTPMVRAILDGQKTQTRRVVKPQPSFIAGDGDPNDSGAWEDGTPMLLGEDLIAKPIRCPYGRPGDVLWVREKWAETVAESGGCAVIAYAAGGSRCVLASHDGEGDPIGTDGECANPWIPDDIRWKPSIHMPFWACRLFLRVKDVRVQRVQETSAKDIIAEGAVLRSFHSDAFEMVGANPQCPVSAFDGKVYPDLRSLWAMGWDSINAKRGFGWKANPLVWPVTFERITKEEARRLAPSKFAKLLKGAA
ncbi:MAG TPA: hypothetical protein P5081_23340 [Phycisphaerae bacterium]|nr:hypothetical protein [Phycisphaerae bacterium]